MIAFAKSNLQWNGARLLKVFLPSTIREHDSSYQLAYILAHANESTLVHHKLFAHP